MRCHIRIEGTERDDLEAWGLVVSVDETRALLARDETFLDIILGEIARVSAFSENGGAVVAALERFARDGTSNPACLIPAEAVQLIRCPDYFAPIDLPIVHVAMKDRRILLPDGQAFELYDFCGVPADRWENSRHRRRREASHIFGYRAWVHRAGPTGADRRGDLVGRVLLVLDRGPCRRAAGLR